MATGVDPEEGATVYTDAMASGREEAHTTSVGTQFDENAIVTPIPSNHQSPSPPATLTSEQGRGNEPPLSVQAGTPLLATNLQQRLETAVATGGTAPPAETGTPRTVPAAFSHIRLPEDPN